MGTKNTGVSCSCGKSKNINKNTNKSTNKSSLEEFLTEHKLHEESGGLVSANFRSLCMILFPWDDLDRDGWKVKGIFETLDRDKDGFLKGQEWKTFRDWLKAIFEPVNALLVVDVQNDFIDGSIALRRCGCQQDGADVIEPINQLIETVNFDHVIYSLDWHPEDHISFYENLHLRELHPDSKVTKNDAKVFSTVIFAKPHLEQILWPKHCVKDTWGAQLHKDLVIAPNSVQLRKGQNSELEAYSVFQDNNSKGSMELLTTLRKLGVTHVYVCGLAYDVCVKATCLDGLRLGYPIAVIDNCCRGVGLRDIEAAKKQIAENCGLITNSDYVLSLVNRGKRSLTLSYQLAKLLSPSSSSCGKPMKDSGPKKATGCSCIK